MTPYWKNFADGVDLNFIPIERDVLDRLERRLGWRRQAPGSLAESMQDARLAAES